MRYQHGLIGLVSLALAALIATGAVYSDQFPQASTAESVGFDALAHELLGDLIGVAPSQGPSK
jgi:hypothetical protein